MLNSLLICCCAADQKGGVCGQLCGEQWHLHHGLQGDGDGCGVLVPPCLCSYLHIRPVCAKGKMITMRRSVLVIFQLASHLLKMIFCWISEFCEVCLICSTKESSITNVLKPSVNPLQVHKIQVHSILDDKKECRNPNKIDHVTSDG